MTTRLLAACLCVLAFHATAATPDDEPFVCDNSCIDMLVTLVVALKVNEKACSALHPGRAHQYTAAVQRVLRRDPANFQKALTSAELPGRLQAAEAAVKTYPKAHIAHNCRELLAE